ncbi:transposase [Gloeomargarita lithophora Alchichica-D10]|uniref:Transposase n=1 Tax=Gloeomargarita lithophora Alchichica-D10 TaxID=1188229 RepID=A0A1J0ADC1_9CYAN|nr:transposase [Gloeomargarita lithophora Alchichica-D10]
MCYSLDLRKKVMSFIENGNSITKAAKVFNVGRATVYRWLDRANLERVRVERRKRKIDIAKLNQDVEQHPDKTLRERAKEFGVVPSSICYQLKRLKITRKKTVAVSRKRS